MKRFAMIGLLGIWSFWAGAQQQFPYPEKLVIDTLDNGLVYYIMPNSYPEGFVEVWFVLDAGSVVETDNQRGFAHFTEHMCFNGTENFPKNEVIHFMESIGVEFGPDVNAFTNLDQTVYMFSKVPAEDSIFEKVVQIRAEMAFKATFDSLEIEKEREVVYNEWRLFSGGLERVLDSILSVLFEGSRYADRLPIGKPEIILHGHADTLRAFYKKWYHPKLSAVIIVGDINVDSARSYIKRYFGNVSGDNPPVRPIYTLPPFEEPRVVTVADSEWIESSISIGFYTKVDTVKTIEDWKNTLKYRLVKYIFKERYSDIAREMKNPPISDAYFAIKRETESIRAIEWGGTVSLKDVKKAFSIIWGEAVRAYQHGFTEGELERAKKKLLRNLKTKAKEKENTESRSWAWKFAWHFLEAEPIFDPKWEHETAQEVLPTITTQDLHRYYKSLWQEKNRYIVITANAEEEKYIPPAKKLIKWMHKLERKRYKPREDVKLVDSLLAPPKQVPPAPEVTLVYPEHDIYKAVLANGITVWMKPTDFKDDEIQIYAFKKGGLSTLPAEKVLPGMLISEVVTEAGAGKFSSSELEKITSGRKASLNFSLDLYSTDLSVNTSPEDIDFALQLLRLYITDPKYDEKTYRSKIKRLILQLAFLDKLPMIYFFTRVMNELYDNNPWAMDMPKKEDLKKVNPQDIYQIFIDKYSNYSDFTYIVVGKFDPEEMSALLQKWLGTLPKASKPEKPINREIYPVCDKPIIKYKGSKKAFAMIGRYAKHTWNSKDDVTADVITRIMDMLVTDSIREENSAIYSGGAFVLIEPDPDNVLSATVLLLPVAPEKIDYTKKSIDEFFQNIAKGNIDSAYIQRAKEMVLKNYEEGLQKNGWWKNKIAYALKHNLNISKFITEQRELVEEVNMEDIKRLGLKLMNEGCKFEAWLLPKEMQEDSAKK